MQKLKVLYLFVFLGTIVFLLVGAISSPKDNLPISNEGRIKFSHSLHKDLVDCQTCHSAVSQSTSLKDPLFPNHDNCSTCHEVDNDQECSTCHYDDTYEALVKSESGLLFNHKIHLSGEDSNCETCHKGLSEVDYSWQSAGANPQMATCYTCHNDKTVASNSCESCHISTVNLLPQDHKVVSFAKTHKFAAQEFNANCVMCHDNQSCEDCHVATIGITEANTLNDFYQPYYSSNFVDGAKVQSINRVHELNYRFTHGIDSRGKTSDCQTCHQIETFCVECHQSENEDFAFGGIVPASHLKPSFKTFGVGTGGGDHATLAKRDIEKCMACHDVNGADPTCISCHFDADGIKGTNSKTHAAGFMRGEEGDWHNDFGSVCYNCHTSATPQSQSGVGFCGYCHGTK
ncbi:MAG: cytochrome C [Ignavibacteriaceae bacterium]|nr:cytochrome C [Ignavibacterium sp.]MCC6255965.1 cytochrome C [Ignavibacteriaceae bacterium]HRN25761.1 cytochrome c3 family protein [Ignavibacteriaceae bacterium]